MRKVIIGLLLLVATVVVVDFGAAAYSEYRVSRTLREGGDLSADPEVIVHGFPFLTQAYDGVYKNVEIRARGVRADVIGETAIEATLHGVAIKASDLIDGNVHEVPVDRVDGRMKIDATELGQLLGIPDLQVSDPPIDEPTIVDELGPKPVPDTPGTPDSSGVVLTGTVPVGGQQVKVSVRADLLLAGNQVRIATSDFYVDKNDKKGVPVPDEQRSAVLGMFDKSIDTRQLPFGLLPTKVTAEGSQIVIEGTGQDVTIDLDQLQKQALP